MVTVVNRTIKIYTDEGAAVAGEQMDLADFFGEEEEFFFDPKIVYDHYAERFVLSCIRKIDAKLYIAWSKTALHTDFPSLADWDKLSTGGGGGAFSFNCGGEALFGAIDHASLGFDGSAWYVSSWLGQLNKVNTANVFYIIEKANAAQTVEHVLSNTFPPGGVCLSNAGPPHGTEGARAAEHAQQPMHEVVENEGEVPTPYFASVVRKETGIACDEPPHNTLRIYSIGDPLEVAHSRTLHAFDLATEECFDAEQEWDGIPTSDSASSGDTWSAVDARLTNAHYRQDGSDEFLYVSHTVNDPVNVGAGLEKRYVIRWYKIDLNGWPGLGAGNPFIDEWGQITESAINVAVHAFLPSIYVNDSQEMAIVYQRSSANSRVSIRAYGRLADGTEVQGVLIEDSATAEVLADPDRLGDYTDIKVDPNGETFWMIGEFIKGGEPVPQASWSTQLAEVEVEPSPLP